MADQVSRTIGADIARSARFQEEDLDDAGCQECQELFQQYKQYLSDFSYGVPKLGEEIFAAQQERAPLLRKAGASEAQIHPLLLIPRLARQVVHYVGRLPQWLPFIAPWERCIPEDVQTLMQKIDECGQKLDQVANEVGVVTKNLSQSTASQLRQLTESELAALTEKAQQADQLAKQVDETLESIRWFAWHNDIWRVELNQKDGPTTVGGMERLADLLPRTASAQHIDLFVKEVMSKMQTELKLASQLPGQPSKIAIATLASTVFQSGGSKAIQQLVDLVVERGVSYALFMAKRVPEQADSLKKSMKNRLLTLIKKINSSDQNAVLRDARDLSGLIGSCFAAQG